MYSTDDMDHTDYYALLGVERPSPMEEITRAYRRLARESHPDLHPEDEAAGKRFAKINEAYQVLSDPEKRAQYDQQLSASAASPYPSQPEAPSSTEYTQDEQPVVHQQTVFVQGADVEEVVGDLAATVQEFANQAAEEMRAALRDFGVELDSIARTFGNTAGNRTMRRGVRPPPQQTIRRPPNGGRPPWNGRPPGEGKAPKP